MAETEEISLDKRIAGAKHLRVEVDRVIQLAQDYAEMIGRGDGGRELSLVITKLQEGKMWGGKILEALGSKLPKEFQDKAE